MAPLRSSPRLVLAILALLLASLGLLVFLPRADEEPPQPLALFTTLPIYWAEGAEITEVLGGTVEIPWARAAIEQHRPLAPLDVLTDEGLRQFADILIAQPRVLSPQENVVLDDWVQGGGHLLLFADPLLTAGSRYSIGDKRRPQDVALVSPILNHWGLSLAFDEAQPREHGRVTLLDGELPIELAGSLELLPPRPETSNSCEVLERGIAAECRINRGKVLVIADAALLDPAATDRADRADMLQRLMDRAFAREGPDSGILRE